MSETATIGERYVNIWNEPDAAVRNATMRELWHPDAVHSAGPLVVRGYDALEQRIAASHEKNVTLAGYRFRPAGDFMVLRNSGMIRWDMIRTGDGAVESAGVAFMILGDDGRIVADYLFVEA